MEFKIKKTKRDGRVALWIKVPEVYSSEVREHNIWDLPPALANNEDVMAAIAHAFELGAHAQSNLARKALADSISCKGVD